MKKWQYDHDLDLLIEKTIKFKDYNEFSCSPFTEMKKNDIASALHAGMLIELRNSAFTIKTVKVQTSITMYQDVVIGHKEAGDIVIDRFAFINYDNESQQEFSDYIEQLSSNIWITSWTEDYKTNEIFSKLFQRVGTKVTSFGELITYWFKPCEKDMFGESRKHPKVSSLESYNIARLNCPVDISDMIKRIKSKLKKLPKFTDHYSNYNKKHSWSALSLRGYTSDPGFITKPSEMSKKWKNENKDTDFKIQDTKLFDEFPEVRTLIKMLQVDTAHRVRFMKLHANTGELDRHTDLVDKDSGLSDGKLMRIHYPIVTNDKVIFESWGLSGEKHVVHMNTGEAWVLDTRKPHRAYNKGNTDRVHLVIDVVSNEYVRNLISQRWVF